MHKFYRHVCIIIWIIKDRPFKRRIMVNAIICTLNFLNYVHMDFCKTETRLVKSDQYFFLFSDYLSLSFCLSFCLLSLSHCLWLSFHCLPVLPFVSLSISLFSLSYLLSLCHLFRILFFTLSSPLYASNCLCMFVCPSARPSICPSVCLSVYLSVFLSLYFGLSLSLLFLSYPPFMYQKDWF